MTAARRKKMPRGYPMNNVINVYYQKITMHKPLWHNFRSQEEQIRRS